MDSPWQRLSRGVSCNTSSVGQLVRRMHLEWPDCPDDQVVHFFKGRAGVHVAGFMQIFSPKYGTNPVENHWNNSWERCWLLGWQMMHKNQAEGLLWCRPGMRMACGTRRNSPAPICTLRGTVVCEADRFWRRLPLHSVIGRLDWDIRGAQAGFEESKNENHFSRCGA